MVKCKQVSSFGIREIAACTVCMQMPQALESTTRNLTCTQVSLFSKFQYITNSPTGKRVVFTMLTWGFIGLLSQSFPVIIAKIVKQSLQNFDFLESFAPLEFNNELMAVVSFIDDRQIRWYKYYDFCLAGINIFVKCLQD